MTSEIPVQHSSSELMKPYAASTWILGFNPIEALHSFQIYLYNCSGCFVTVKITSTNMIYLVHFVQRCIDLQYISSSWLNILWLVWYFSVAMHRYGFNCTLPQPWYLYQPAQYLQSHDNILMLQYQILSLEQGVIQTTAKWRIKNHRSFLTSTHYHAIR